MVTIEQRRHIRLKPTQPIKVKVKPAGFLGHLMPAREAELVDISGAGIGLRVLKGEFRQGQKVRISITLASVLPAIDGQIMWTTDLMNGIKLGIHFDQGREEVERFMRLNKHAFREG